MPYRIVKRSGPKPYRIINRQTGKVVGTSTSLAKARRSIGHRMSGEKSKKFKRVVDNKMKNYGDYDEKKRVVRIRKKKFRTKPWKKGEVIDTIVHEEMHAKHPKMHEKTVRRKTTRKINRMSRNQKNRNYARYKRNS